MSSGSVSTLPVAGSKLAMRWGGGGELGTVRYKVDLLGGSVDVKDRLCLFYNLPWNWINVQIVGHTNNCIELCDLSPAWLGLQFQLASCLSGSRMTSSSWDHLERAIDGHGPIVGFAQVILLWWYRIILSDSRHFVRLRTFWSTSNILSDSLHFVWLQHFVRLPTFCPTPDILSDSQHFFWITTFFLNPNILSKSRHFVPLPKICSTPDYLSDFWHFVWRCPETELCNCVSIHWGCSLKETFFHRSLHQKSKGCQGCGYWHRWLHHS